MEPIMETLYRMKKRATYKALAKQTGAPEQALLRWLTGKCQMSKAWEALIRSNLSE